MSERPCNKCGGSGTLYSPELTAPSSPCWQCGGTGYLNVVTYACVACIEKDQRIRELEAEVARVKQEKADALNVRSKDGLLSSEWIARTGAAERRAEAAEAEVARLREVIWRNADPFDASDEDAEIIEEIARGITP